MRLPSGNGHKQVLAATQWSDRESNMHALHAHTRRTLRSELLRAKKMCATLTSMQNVPGNSTSSRRFSSARPSASLGRCSRLSYPPREGPASPRRPQLASSTSTQVSHAHLVLNNGGSPALTLACFAVFPAAVLTLTPIRLLHARECHPLAVEGENLKYQTPGRDGSFVGVSHL